MFFKYIFLKYMIFSPKDKCILRTLSEVRDVSIEIFFRFDIQLVRIGNTNIQCNSIWYFAAVATAKHQVLLRARQI